MIEPFCPFAIRVPVPRTFKINDDGEKIPFRLFAKGQPSAFLIHTGGGGGPKAAAHWNKLGKRKPKPQALIDLGIIGTGPWTEEEVFFCVYLMEGMGLPHVANGFGGKLVQYASQRLALPHAGTSHAQRVALSTEEWRGYVADAFEVAFAKMFPRLKSPLELTDGTSANPKTGAMEFCQLPRRDRITGMLFTQEQIEAGAAYGVYFSRQAGFELPEYERGVPFGNRKNAKRLLWHGVVNPFPYPHGRTTSAGEVDPGILKPKDPTFDLDAFCVAIGKAKIAASHVSVTPTRAMVDRFRRML